LCINNFMEDNNKHNNQYSLFRRGADDGMMFGLYMSILMLSLLGSLSLPWLNLLCMAMIAGVPFYVYWRLRKGYADEGGTMQVSALWMQGIVMFFCASLIMALAVYVYLKFIDTDYISRLINMTKEMAGRVPEYSAMLGEVDLDAVAKIVTPIKLSMELLWMGVFSGSLLSLAEAMIVPIKKLKSK